MTTHFLNPFYNILSDPSCSGVKYKVLHHALKYCKVIYHNFLNIIRVSIVDNLSPSTDAFHKSFCISEQLNDQCEKHLNRNTVTHDNTD